MFGSYGSWGMLLALPSLNISAGVTNLKKTSIADVVACEIEERGGGGLHGCAELQSGPGDDHVMYIIELSTHG
jgi:hypothetical protein